jgi:REP element-mobilizing transposase RayT
LPILAPNAKSICIVRVSTNVHSSGSPPSPLESGFHFRGQLPHLKRTGATYFVTFRLSDSLPGCEIARLKAERRALLDHARAAKSPLTWHEEQLLLAWYCDKVESLLDAGSGACWLSKPAIANLVTSALNFFRGDRYDLSAWVVMPNHVHAVVWPYPNVTLSRILHSWKSFTSKQASQLLPIGISHFWQRESFDHWIRSDEERGRLVAYVENNPVKAQLCARREDWPWSSAYRPQ